MQEIWKPVSGFESLYEVSNLGRVRSLDRVCVGPSGRERRRKGQLMRQTLTDGYFVIRMFSAEGSKIHRIHRLVATEFCRKTEGCDVINHKDGVKTNNHADNLEWTTVRGNTIHSYENGLQSGRKGSRHHKAILTEDDVRSIIKSLKAGTPQKHIAKIYGVTNGSITNINTGKQWGHVHVPECGKPPYFPRSEWITMPNKVPNTRPPKQA